MIASFLTFSDSAKFAEAAKSFINGQGLVIHHTFFNPSLISGFVSGQSFPAGFLPLTSWILALAFKFLPASDTTVSLVGWSFYTLCSLLIVLITARLSSLRTGLVAGLFFVFNPYFWDYASNSSSEIFFLSEVLLFIYFAFVSRAKWAAVFPLALMFLTRQQAVVFLVAAFVFVVVHTRKFWLLVAAVVSLFLLYKVSRVDVSSVYSPLRSFYSSQMSTSVAPGAYLRGVGFQIAPPQIKPFVSKIFYNSYNFFKNPSRLMSPVLFWLFMLSLLIVSPRLLAFKQFTFIAVSLFVLAAAASLPNARYVHIVIPLALIMAADSMVWIVSKLNFRWNTLALVFLAGVIIFPELGHLTLDARFRANQFNLNRPPATKVISDVLAANVPQGKLIVTNLDAWAAWYHGLTTMWFPLTPDQLQPTSGNSRVEYIAITNYLESDADFALGEWAEVVYRPESISNQFLSRNFTVTHTFKIPAGSVYENREYRGTILKRKLPVDSSNE